MKKIIFYLIIYIISFAFVLSFLLFIFKPIFIANSLIFPFAINPFDIVKVYPKTWNLIIKFYFMSFFFSFSILFSKFLKFFKHLFSTHNHVKHKKEKTITHDLSLFLGLENKNYYYISEKGLYQNILITGTIGTGKTSSAMYPFTKQLIEYKSSNSNEKLAMLILDVKGNYFNQVINFANTYNRLKDIISIDLSGKFKYNPLDKPDLTPIVLANRLKTILTIFSPNNSESYWLDKVEQILAEAIKFCRLYNNNYVSFSEIHKLIMFPEYYSEKLSIAKQNFTSRKIQHSRCIQSTNLYRFF